MWSHSVSSIEQLSALETFLDVLRTSADFFQEDVPLYVARAPGRLDVIGGIADYSGSLVLEMPLAVATLAAVQSTSVPEVVISSTAIARGGDSVQEVRFPLHTLCPPGEPLDYPAACHLLTADPRQAWAAYIAGVLVVLQRERHIEFAQGLRIFVHCDVPIGKGVSSSASLEVATMQAISTLAEYPLDEQELAALCQKVENAVVGAPCGIMDQVSVVSGKPGHLLALLCQPAELQEALAVPDEIEFWGIDSGIRHAVTGNAYEAVRIGAFMGYRILAEKAGLKTIQRGSGLVEIADPLWGGYLANITPSIWERFYRDAVPLSLSGADFLSLYHGTTDPVTSIRPDQLYAVRQPTAHPIYEHQRVRQFRALLSTPLLTEEHLLLLGELMYQAHASYSACGLGSAGTDRLVQMVAEAGPEHGLYGAKITGGGSGGTVAILARREAGEQVQKIAQQYEKERGQSVSLLSGTSAGAFAWGTIVCQWDKEIEPLSR